MFKYIKLDGLIKQRKCMGVGGGVSSADFI